MKKTKKNITLSSGDAKRLTATIICTLLTYGIFLVASPFLLLRAAKNRSDGGINFLLACGARPNSFMFYGDLGYHSPLLETVYNDDWDAARRLIEHGADVNCNDYNGGSPLLCAAIDSEVNMVRLLIQRGASVDQKDGMPYTSLYYTVNERGAGRADGTERLEIIRLLLRAGANPNIASPIPGAALREAKRNLPEAVPLLLTAGAKP